MPKTKVFAARNLEDGLPNLPLKTGEAKKKIKVFLSGQFCASLKHRALVAQHRGLVSSIEFS